jgi:uncharacterized protein YecT (DUF1311 family)
MKSLQAVLWISIAAFLGISGLHAQTQADLNQQSCGELRKADASLNATYSKILKEYGNDAQFISKLKAAQRAWLAFRDAELEARFPKTDKQAEYGSVYPMGRCTQLQELTEQRTKELRTWLDGIPEGDVCARSVRTAGAGHSSVVPASSSQNCLDRRTGVVP